MATKTRVIRWFSILKRLWSETRDCATQVVDIDDVAIQGKYFYSSDHPEGFNILDVFDNPEKFPGIMQNVESENPDGIIMVDPQMIPIDGILRVGKAILEGRKTVKIIIVDRKKIEEIAPGFDDRKYWPSH